MSHTAIPAGYRYVNGIDPPNNGGDVEPPTVPQSLIATGIAGSNTVALTWNASSDNIEVTGYRLLRSVGFSSSNVSESVTTPATSFIDTRLEALFTYNYLVRALDAAGNQGGGSSVASVLMPPQGLRVIVE